MVKDTINTAETPQKDSALESNANAAPSSVNSAATAPKGPRSYLVMMLLAIMLLPTGLARAYRGEQIGWTRFWIYVGATVAGIIPVLNIVALLVLLALCVWGAIDVFQLRKTRTDAEGGALSSTPRDDKFAHAFFIYFIVSLALAGIALLIGLVFGAFLLNSIMNSPGGFSNFENNYNNGRSLQEFESQYR